MSNFSWKYDNLSMVDGELESYNTLYIDKASINHDGLILIYKDKVIGFINLANISGLFKKVYISKTGLLLTNASFYIDALISLEDFVVSEGIIIISQVDYLYKKKNYFSKISSFLGKMFHRGILCYHVILYIEMLSIAYKNVFSFFFSNEVTKGPKAVLDPRMKIKPMGSLSFSRGEGGTRFMSILGDFLNFPNL